MKPFSMMLIMQARHQYWCK